MNKRIYLFLLLFFITITFLLKTNLIKANIFFNKAEKVYKNSGVQQKIEDRKFPPKIIIISPLNNEYVGDTIIIHGTASDNEEVKRVEIQIDEGMWIPLYNKFTSVNTWVWEYTWNTRSSLNGQRIIKARAYDNSENYSEMSTAVNVNNYEVSINIVSLIKGKENNTNDVTIYGTASSLNSTIKQVSVNLDNGVWTTASGTENWTKRFYPLSLGQHTISCYAEDLLNNRSKTTQISFFIDNKIPEVNITYPPFNYFKNYLTNSTTILVQGTAESLSNALVNVKVKINNENWIPANGTTNWSLSVNTFKANDINYIYAKSSNVSGNVSSIAQHAVVVDTLPPVIYFSNITTNSVISLKKIKGSASDTFSEVKSFDLKINNSNWISISEYPSWSYYASNITNGLNTIYYRAKDIFDNEVISSGINFIKTNCLYVSKTGNDNNLAMKNRPLATIQKGINLAYSNECNQVLISEGIYQENLVLLNGVSILGGFSQDFINRDLNRNNYRTVIDGGEIGSCIKAFNLTQQTIIEGLVIKNGKSDYGGGIYITNSANTFKIRDNDIISNQAVANVSLKGGAGINLMHCLGEIYNNKISFNQVIGNSMSYGGSGLAFFHSYCNVYNNLITYNIGRAFHITGSSLSQGSVIYNNSFIGNIANSSVSSAIYLWPFSGESILNNTFYSNDSTIIYFQESGGYSGMTSVLNINNNIFQGSNASSGIFINKVYNNCNYANNCFYNIQNKQFVYDSSWKTNEAQLGNNNIVSNALLQSDSIHIQANSPCIDKGLPLISTDIDGEARPKGAGYDIGCDEY